MKIFIKYKSLSFLMILVFASSYVVFNYNMQAKLTEKFEYQDKKNNRYEYETTILVVPNITLYDENINYAQYISAAITKVDKENINISIVDISPLIDDYGVRSLASLYIDGVQPKYPLIKGDYPNAEQLKTNDGYVVLGKNKKKYVYTEDGKDYIYLDGERYLVTGYISTSKSHYLDNQIIIYSGNEASNMWQSVNDYLKMGMVQIVFVSDANMNLYYIANEFREQISLVSYGLLETYVISESESTKITTSYVPQIRYRKWAWLAYAFCIVSNTFLLQYWIMQRKKEFIIKKIYGFSAFRILRDFFFETLLLILISILLGELFVLANGILATGLAVFDIEIFAYMGLIIIGYMCVSMVLILICPIIWLCKCNPVSMINSKRGTRQ